MAILNLNFVSNTLMKTVELTIILPVDQATPTTKKAEFPLKTLYLLHGIMGNHNDWLYYSDIARLARKHQLAVVLPSGDNHFYVNKPEIHQNYSDFITQELPDFLESFLPLSSHRKDRFLGGFSMGGYGAIINGLNANERFSHIIGISSALILDDVYALNPPVFDQLDPQSYYQTIFGDLNSLKNSEKDYEYLAKHCSAPKPKIFLACGKEDSLLSANQRFATLLTQQNFDVTYIENSGSHNWAYWSEMIYDVFEWLPIKNVEI